MTQSEKPASSSEASNSAAAEAPKGQDVALIHGRTEDGAGLKVLRAHEDRIEAGVIRPLVQGQAINGEVLRLEPRKDFPLLCDVHVELDARPASRSTGHGPAQVATDTYRKNWDAIYSRRREDDELLN